MQDFMVTDLDEAIVSRMSHFTLVHDAKQWVLWATANNIDPRGISFVSRYPEMLVGGERTNPRSYTKFFRFLKTVPNLNDPAQFKRAQMQAKSVLDDSTVSTMLTFMRRDVELVIEPEDILNGENWVQDKMKKLSDGIKNEKTGEIDRRIDILAVTVDRLFAYMARPGFKPVNGSIQHFQDFATSKYLEDDMCHNLCMRIFRRGGMQQWLLNNEQLTDLVMDVV